MRIIAGTARSRKIETPKGTNTRPTLDRVRENLFNILQNRIRSAVVLDLFSGSGALSFESVSRGASYAVLCDSDREANRTERKNAEALGFSDRTEILCCDWRTALSALNQREMVFDLVFLDPPYRMTDLREVFLRLEPLIHGDSLVIVEHEAGRQVLAGDRFQKTDERKWGFCGMSFYRKDSVKTVEASEDGK